MGLLCKMCAADPRDLATKFPKNSGTWGSWLGLGLAGPLWAAVGPELKKVEGPEFPPWGAGHPVVVGSSPVSEYPEFCVILLVELGFGGGDSLGARRNGILAATADAARARMPGAVDAWIDAGPWGAVAAEAVIPTPLARTSIESILTLEFDLEPRARSPLPANG